MKYKILLMVVSITLISCGNISTSKKWNFEEQSSENNSEEKKKDYDLNPERIPEKNTRKVENTELAEGYSLWIKWNFGNEKHRLPKKGSFKFRFICYYEDGTPEGTGWWKKVSIDKNQGIVFFGGNGTLINDPELDVHKGCALEILSFSNKKWEAVRGKNDHVGELRYKFDDWEEGEKRKIYTAQTIRKSKYGWVWWLEPRK